MFGSTHKEPKEHDPSEALAREIGVQLREARELRGEEIEDVAEVLRIRPAYLYGLEQGDLAVIPGRAYALGFLRSYARHLGFDGDELVAQIRSRVADLAGAAPLYGRTPLSDNRLPKLPILVISLAALAGGYVGWSWVDDRSRTESELVAEVPEAMRPSLQDPMESQIARLEIPAAEIPTPELLLPEPARSGVERVLDPDILPAIAPAPGSEAPVPESDGPAEDVEVAAVETVQEPESAPRAANSPEADLQEAVADEPVPDPVRPVPAIAPVQPEVAAPDQPAGGEAAADAVPPAAELLAALEPVEDHPASPAIHRIGDAAGRVMLRARSRAWVHVSSTNNDLLWVKILQPGEAVVVPDRPDLVLWTGNAGGIEVMVDGTPLPPLGPEAAVVRDVPLQPEALVSRLSPTPPAVPAPDAESGGL